MQIEPDKEAGGTEAEEKGQGHATVLFLAALEVDRRHSWRRLSGSGTSGNKDY